MSSTPPQRLEQRVLALGPYGKDAALIKSVLAEVDIECCLLANTTELMRELASGAGALITTEEAVLGGMTVLADFVRNQPAWSELPVLIVTGRESNSPVNVQFTELLGNVTLIERPMRLAVLVSVVRAALRARRRQYQIREYITERERIEESLRETDRRKDEFLAALAHELRNPLAPLSNTLQLLAQHHPSDNQAHWAHSIMERQVQHLTRLVDDLLDVSRITRGKLTLRRELVELKSVIRNAVETSQPLIDAAGHQLVISLPDEPLRLHADPVRLAQALSNLLNNAAKYTPHGGRIELQACREEDWAVIRVRDNGIGMDAALLPRVFELFVQADNGLARSQGGLGIGLTLVNTFVSLHGGSVEATSEGAGLGSVFTLRLPLFQLRQTDEPLMELPQAAGGSPQARKILVVDDNQDGAHSLALLLQLHGNEVQTVYDGPEAVAAAAQFHPDVVLLDIGLPTLNGYETARRMRADPTSKNLLIIALTGWGQEEDRRRSREAGFDHHLIKPVDLQVLEALLAN